MARSCEAVVYIYVGRVKATEQWRREKMEEWLM
jgi:hypothetical protein